MAGKQPPPQVKPWDNHGVVQMAPPLHDLPKHPKRWLPKCNTYDGLLAEEHLHNYILAINLNGVAKEDFVVRLFPYTLQGSAGS